MDFLTSENEFIYPQIASKRIRIGAALIDFLIIWVIGFILGIFWGEWYTDSEGFGVKLMGFGKVAIVAAWIIVFPLIEGLGGQTIGKKLLGIVVIRENLRPTNIWTSFVRHLFDLIDLILFIGLIVATLNTKKKRIGDFIAGTLVVIKK
jgi:uncharacterized RDD family membrane protein YckC